MKVWQISKGATSLDDFKMVERPKPVPGAGEVLVRVRACSLNYRDRMIMTGNYMGGAVSADTVPLSDGAGDVEAVGAGVTLFKPGDRVAATFFQSWLAGPPNGNVGHALGCAPADGMLAEYVALPQTGLVHLAKSLSFEQAATLPCAGVTAWNALMAGPRPVGPGRTVLLLGTGGVSLLALQIAKAAGARVIITSSSDDKLARARAMGADDTINYRTTPEWGAAAASLSGGIDHVVEVGGQGTLAQSIASIGFCGEIALIGVLSREGHVSPRDMMFKGASLRGIFVGSAEMAHALNKAVDQNAITPHVGKVFSFDQAKEAYHYQMSPDLYGKIVIAV
jgi:NADPH:quinone reductase-like Zn-dependent oxidoreductase